MHGEFSIIYLLNYYYFVMKENKNLYVFHRKLKILEFIFNCCFSNTITNTFQNNRISVWIVLTKVSHIHKF